MKKKENINPLAPPPERSAPRVPGILIWVLPFTVICAVLGAYLNTYVDWIDFGKGAVIGALLSFIVASIVNMKKGKRTNHILYGFGWLGMMSLLGYYIAKPFETAIWIGPVVSAVVAFGIWFGLSRLFERRLFYKSRKVSHQPAGFGDVPRPQPVMSVGQVDRTQVDVDLRGRNGHAGGIDLTSTLGKLTTAEDLLALAERDKQANQATNLVIERVKELRAWLHDPENNLEEGDKRAIVLSALKQLGVDLPVNSPVFGDNQTPVAREPRVATFTPSAFRVRGSRRNI